MFFYYMRRRQRGNISASHLEVEAQLLTSLPDEPQDWRRLDAMGMLHLKMAEANLATTAPMGTPVIWSPAGNYVGIYWQYGHAHPIPAQAMECTPKEDTAGIAVGNGFDDVGTFNMVGTYKLAKLKLTKQYVPGSGDPRENLGHAVELRLTCCDLFATLPSRAPELQSWGCPPGNVGFYGTWHVRTRNYKGDAEMCLWLPPVPVVIGYVITQTMTSMMQAIPYDSNGDGVVDASQTRQTYTMSTTTQAQYGIQLQSPFGPKAEVV